MSTDFSKNSTHPFLINKKASYDYSFEKSYIAGVVLTGNQIKSFVGGRVSFADAYIVIENGEAFIKNLHIHDENQVNEFFIRNVKTYNSGKLKLLLHKSEINKLIGASQQDGYTIIPTKFLFQNRKVKVEVTLAKGKKNYDKRAAIKERDWNRQKNRGYND